MTSLRITAGALADSFEHACAQLDRIGFADALWSRRLDVWTGDPATQAKIANRQIEGPSIRDSAYRCGLSTFHN